MGINYYAYIESEEWRQRANAAKLRAGYRCQVCNRPSSEVTLDAHHRTYERLGDELPEDITVLCRGCHELYETRRKSMKLLPVNNVSLPLVSTLKADKSNHYFTLTESADPSSESIEYDSEYYNPDNHLLPVLGKLVHSVGYIGNTIYFLWIEWAIISRNPIEILSPFLQLQTLGNWITSPLFWQYIAITTVGLVLMFLGRWIVNKVNPKTGLLRWYWKWGASALIKVPLFFVSVAIAIVVILQTAFTWLGLGTEIISENTLLLSIGVLKIYSSLLLIPAVHLIWNNRLRNTWAKLGISLVVLPLLIVGILTIDLWWGKQVCTYNLLSEWQCAAYQRYFSQATTTKPTSTPESTLVNATPTQQVDFSSWQKIQSDKNILKMEIPSEWVIAENGTDNLHVAGSTNGAGLRWYQSDSEYAIQQLYERVQNEANVRHKMKEDMDNYTGQRLKTDGGELITNVGPFLRTIGDIKTIFFDATMRLPDALQTPIRSIHLAFDCIPEYTCEVDYYHTGTDSISKDEWRLLEYLVQSIELSPE